MELTLYSAVELQNVDVRDMRSVVSGLTASIESTRIERDEEALRNFRIGCMMVNYLNQKGIDKLSIKEMAAMANTSVTNLKHYRDIASKYKKNEKLFLEHYHKLGCTSWYSFMHKIMPTKKKYVKAPRSVKKALDIMLSDLRNNTYDKDTYNTLKELRDVVNKYIPVRGEIIDINVLSYNNCCGCDEPAPPEGYEIYSKKDSPHIKYPLCHNCTEPDYKLVANLYVIHSIELEEAYEKIL